LDCDEKGLLGDRLGVSSRSEHEEARDALCGHAARAGFS
jgi:hypothetical protein